MSAFFAMLDFWDYVTFGCLAIVVAGFMALIVIVLGLPGRVAVARRHPDAEAVNLLGWLGFAAVLPWAQALIWSLKPADVVDVRRLPREEQKAIDEDMARLAGTPTKKQQEPDDLRPPPRAASEDHTG
jgi:hypothetical protein